MITLYVDGLCEPNPNGVACWGWIAQDATGAALAHGCGCLPADEYTTNNVAEYEAAIQGLRWAYQAGHYTLLLCSDSQLLIQQITGAWSCSAPTLQSRYARLQRAQSVMQITWRWVPREQNTQADGWSRTAYQQRTGRPPPDRPRRA